MLDDKSCFDDRDGTNVGYINNEGCLDLTVVNKMFWHGVVFLVMRP